MLLKNKAIFYQTLSKHRKWLVAILILFVATDIIARAGGAGGNDDSGGGSSGDGSGGDGSGIVMILYYILRLIMMLPFPLNWIVLLIVIVIAYYILKENKETSTYNSLDKLNHVTDDDSSISQITATIPNFNLTEFYEKVTTSFYKIQDSWEAQNLSPVRQFISDGVYQRFNAQFIMMRELKQHNELSNIKLLNKKIVLAENDGNFFILHVRIDAEIKDLFISEKFPELNSGGSESFTEYWTYTKKANSSSNKNIFNNDNCPNCGDSIQNKLGEISKCPSCGTQINNGEYDWVLSEITQAEDFATNYSQRRERKDFYNRLKNKGYQDSEFSPQYIEDKASNAFLQIKIAEALTDEKRVNRFCSDEYTSNLKSSFKESFLYNRLYLNDVQTLNIYSDSSKLYAAVKLKYTQQRVSINNGKLNIIHQSPFSTNEYLILSRNKNYSSNKYSAMAHNCSGCGAPVEDSLQLTCKYCASALNDNTKDWIVESLLTKGQYSSFKDGFNNNVSSQKQEQKLEDDLMDVRDYVLNNMMLVAMSDGELQDEERELMINISKKLGYNTKKITELFNEIKANQLALKMPDDAKKREKVIKQMRKMAEANGIINETEKQIIAQAELMK